jgi:hypothetical protein
MAAAGRTAHVSDGISNREAVWQSATEERTTERRSKWGR